MGDQRVVRLLGILGVVVELAHTTDSQAARQSRDAVGPQRLSRIICRESNELRVRSAGRVAQTLFRPTSMRTSLVPISFAAKFLMALTARGARFLNALRHAAQREKDDEKSKKKKKIFFFS